MTPRVHTELSVFLVSRLDARVPFQTHTDGNQQPLDVLSCAGSVSFAIASCD